MKEFQIETIQEIKLFEKRIIEISKELEFEIIWFYNKAEFWIKENGKEVMVGIASLKDKKIYAKNKACLIYFPLHYFQNGIKLLEVG